MNGKKFAPLTIEELRWAQFYLHPMQFDEIFMRPPQEAARLVRDLMARSKPSYRAQIQAHN